MPSTHPAKSARKSGNLKWWLGGLLFLAFLTVGVITILLQKQLRKEQDVRSQGVGYQGTVLITAEGKGNSIQSGTTSYIDFAIDTKDFVVGKVDLNFDVLLPDTVTGPISPATQLTLLNPAFKVTSSAVGVIATPLPSGQRGWRVSLVADPADPAVGFQSKGAQSLFRLELPMPMAAGQLQVVFNQTTSQVFTWYVTSEVPAIDVLAPVPDINLPIGQTACTYTYSAWSACQNGQQTRSYTAAPTTCAAPDPTFLSQACLPQCSYTYSNWGSCVNGWQTRTYAQTPASCTWYQTETLQPLTQACNSNTPNSNFAVYTYESCWATQSSGNTSYVMWNKTTFPGVTKVDVSTTSDFATYANKDVTNATDTLGANYLVTDGTNFRTSDTQQLWVFWPGYTYYFRLLYANGQHSPVITYFVPKCAGASTTSYKLCNESCSNNSECSANLACVSGQCRRADNSGSNICATPPDQGLRRACNDYCADSRECSSGLTCWWNRCRLPKNPEDTSCRVAAPQKVVYVTAATNYTNYVTAGTGVAEAACNGSCNTNRDCAADLRCYQGSCRLPANVTNTRCQTVAAAQAAEEAASRSAQPTMSAAVIAPSVSPTLAANTMNTQTTWFSTTGQWLASRLGFLIAGLILAVLILLVWPMLRTSFVPVPVAVVRRPEPTRPPVVVPPAQPTQPAQPVQPVQRPMNQVMTPPPSAMRPPQV